MDISDCMELCRANGFASLTEAITAARTSKAELEQLRTDYQRICHGDARLRQERDEARAEIERLRGVLTEAGHYVAICPPPPEATGALRMELLEWRGRIAQASRDPEQKVKEG